jgi:hypothetical protein
MRTIDWRQKALAFWIFDKLPLGRQLYYQVQKRITKTVPRVLAPTSATAQRFCEHYRAIAGHLNQDLLRARFMEFGAGWDLYGNIVFWSLGINRQVVFDLHRWAKPDQVNSVIRHLMADPPPGAIRTPQRTVRPRGRWEADLQEFYGIEYRAPADASHTDLPDGCIDAIVTTSVLEHIPEPEILRLLEECRRLMHQSSVMSHAIEYSDHYSHSDPSIGPYNFLKFSDDEWERFNPGLHFQNRMRHCDYRTLFQDSGFQVVWESHDHDERAAELIAGLRLAERFQGRAVQELLPVSGHYVLKKL